jgi:hypothetical protein
MDLGMTYGPIIPHVILLRYAVACGTPPTSSLACKFIILRIAKGVPKRGLVY